MVKYTNIIEVNGKRFDAQSGKLLSAAKPTKAAKSQGVSLDGVAKKPRSTQSVPGAHAVHKSPERSKTLMRTAVKNPANNKKAHIKAKSGMVDGVRKPAKKTAYSHPEVREQKVPVGRLERAQLTPKSTQISRYGRTKVTKPQATVAPLAVKQAPGAFVRQIETQVQHAVQKTINPFHHAIENATSHTQPKIKKTSTHHKIAHRLNVHPRIVSMSAGAMAVVIIAGFFAYQNVPNLTMRVAAAKAGVRGSLPSYKPAGFSLNGPVHFTPGQITIAYKSNSDDRSFKLVQKSTEWNSETLLSNYVAKDQRPYQSYQEEDKTIYIYDSNNATWIERGVWYQVEGNGALSSDQLLRIANSL